MLIFIVIGMGGLACATAFRWPVMFLLAAFVFAASSAVQLSLGAHWGDALTLSVLASMTLELTYVIGGAVLSTPIRRVAAKKNLKA